MGAISLRWILLLNTAQQWSRRGDVDVKRVLSTIYSTPDPSKNTSNEPTKCLYIKPVIP